MLPPQPLQLHLDLEVKDHLDPKDLAIMDLKDLDNKDPEVLLLPLQQLLLDLEVMDHKDLDLKDLHLMDLKDLVLFLLVYPVLPQDYLPLLLPLEYLPLSLHWLVDPLTQT